MTGDEILTTAFPLQSYAFGASPAPTGDKEQDREFLAYLTDDVVLVAFDGDRPVAVAAGIPMRQHVRGRVLPMLGVGGVASHPTVRRRGHVRAVLRDLHGWFRDEGHPVAALYPFRPSFYERYGYVSFPVPRKVRLHPDGLDRLLRVEVPGEVTFSRVGERFDDYQAFGDMLVGERHGFATPPRARARQGRDADDQWLVLAHHDGETVGALLYRTTGHGAELRGQRLLTRTPVGRTLILQWLAHHADQYDTFTCELPPGEHPELWYPDIHYDDETRIVRPVSTAPMARVLSVDGLAGLTVGSAKVTVEVVDDPFVAGTWTLDGTGGALEVVRGGTPVAQLTAHGLAALVYGVLDPVEIGLLGYGAIDSTTAAALRVLFPPALPYLHARF